MSESSFHIDPELAPKLIAFDRLFSAIDAPYGAIEALRDRFIAEFPWTVSTTQIEQMVQDCLGSGPWRWQWHSEWRQRFELVGAFPRMWTTLSRVRPSALRDTGSYDHRVFLLAHSLVHQGYAERVWQPNLAEQVLIRINKPISDEPPSVLNILQQCIDDYVNGVGPAATPPFFPGDRTGTDLVLSTRERSLEQHAKIGVVCQRRPRL